MPGQFSRQLSKRVQEFELWKDDKDVFKDVEYARRRAERRREVKKLDSDRRLRRWKKVYIPSLLAILSSTVALLCSSISSLGRNSFFTTHKDIIYIVGPVILISGVIGLMFAAACSYREEERLRKELGLPSQFPIANVKPPLKAMKLPKRQTSTKACKVGSENRVPHQDWRIASSDSLEISNFLESSTSSATTDTTWLQHSTSTSSSFRPLILESAEIEVFEKSEEEGDYDVVVDDRTLIHTSCNIRRLSKAAYTKAFKTINESTEYAFSENSSGYSTVTGSEPDNTENKTPVSLSIVPGINPGIVDQT